MKKGAVWFLELLLAQWMHWVYVAQTRYGKSEFVRAWLVPALRARAFGCTIIDPAGTMVTKIKADLAYMGREENVFLIQFAPAKPGEPARPTVGFHWMTRQWHEDPLELRDLNEVERDRHKKRMLARRGIQDLSKAPLTEEWLNLALDVWLYQDEPCPEYWLLGLFTPESPEQMYLLAHCTRLDLVVKVLSVNDMAPKVRRDNTSPAMRILEGFYGKATVLKHTGATFDFDAALDAGAIFLIDSSGAEDDQAIVMEQAIIQKIFDKARRGLKKRHRIIIDEGQKRIDVNIAQQLREIAKFGVALDLMLQNPLDITSEEIRNNVFGNTYHWWGRQGNPDGAQFASDDVGTRLLDDTKIWYVEEDDRLEHDGYEFRQVVSTNVTKDEKGNERKGETLGSQALSKYRRVKKVKEHRKRYEDQIKDVKRELMTCGKGCFWLAHEFVTEKMLYEPLLGLPWPKLPKWREAMVEQWTERIRSKPWYRVPTLIKPPCPTTTTVLPAEQESPLDDLPD